MADKDFRVKNRLHVNGLTNTSGVILATNNALDSHTNVPTQYGGTGTTQSPAAGQVLFSSAGTTYTPTTLTSLDVKGATYSADAPANPVVGQVWIESDSSSDSFDPNIMRRKTITATAGQTTFTTDLSFIQGYEQVYFNGMLLIRNDDYTTPSNTSVVLANAAAVGDIVEILSITNLNSINAATTTTNTFTGTQIINATGGWTTHNIGKQLYITTPTNSSNPAIGISDATGSNNWAIINSAGSYRLAQMPDFSSSASVPVERMIIDSSGNVGIGTGQYYGVGANKFRISHGSDNSIFVINQYKNDGGSSSIISISDDRGYGGTNTGNMLYGYAFLAGSMSSHTGNLIKLETFNGAAFSPAFTVGYNGNIYASGNSSFANSSYAGKNVIINGAMDIWQRGTSFPSGVGLASNVVYSADRWHWYRGNNDTGATLTRQSAGLTGFQYCIRMQRNSGNTSLQALGLRYTAETADSVRFAGKQVTLSFWARKGANYSGSSNAFRATVATGTGTDQVVHSFTGFAYIIDQNITLTDTWQRFILTGTAASNITQIGLEMFHTPTGTAGANDYMEITGIQLEEGSVATTFSRYAGGIQQELAACQRYYQILGDNIYELIYGGYMVSGNTGYISFPYPVTMRTTPTGTLVGSWAVFNTSQPVIQSTHPKAISLRAACIATGQFYFHSNTGYYVTMSAEL